MNKLGIRYNRKGFTKSQNAAIEKAFNFALEAHGEQLRASGEPYIIHPIAVAETVASGGWITSR